MAYTAPRPTTHQEVFDIVARHLLTQSAKSLVVLPGYIGPQCAYRGDNGLMCAAGVLLDDDEVGSDNVEAGWSIVCPPRLSDSYGVVVDLQWIHDRTPVADWPDALRNTAAVHNLSAAVVDQLSPPAI